MPITVNGVGIALAAVTRRDAARARLGVPTVENGLFDSALRDAIRNWGATVLDTLVAPVAAVNGFGNVSYTIMAGNVRHYAVNWQVTVQNWVLHTSCNVTIADVW